MKTLLKPNLIKIPKDIHLIYINKKKIVVNYQFYSPKSFEIKSSTFYY